MVWKSKADIKRMGSNFDFLILENFLKWWIRSRVALQAGRRVLLGMGWEGDCRIGIEWKSMGLSSSR
jgi:hypothetical protein